MNPRETPAMFVADTSFDVVLDRTCSRLWERKIQYSMRQIQDLEDRLAELERELDGLVISRDPGGTG